MAQTIHTNVKDRRNFQNKKVLELANHNTLQILNYSDIENIESE